MEEGITLIQLREGGQQAFSRLFTLYYRDLVLYAGRYLPEQAACEDIVQDTFLKVWNLRDRLDIAVSLRALSHRGCSQPLPERNQTPQVGVEHLRRYPDVDTCSH